MSALPFRARRGWHITESMLEFIEAKVLDRHVSVYQLFECTPIALFQATLRVYVAIKRTQPWQKDSRFKQTDAQRLARHWKMLTQIVSEMGKEVLTRKDSETCDFSTLADALYVTRDLVIVKVYVELGVDLQDPIFLSYAKDPFYYDYGVEDQYIYKYLLACGFVEPAQNIDRLSLKLESADDSTFLVDIVVESGCVVENMFDIPADDTENMKITCSRLHRALQMCLLDNERHTFEILIGACSDVVANNIIHRAKYESLFEQDDYFNTWHSLLHMAAEGSFAGAVGVLIDKYHVPVDFTDSQQYYATPLIDALEIEQDDDMHAADKTVRALIERHADVTARNYIGLGIIFQPGFAFLESTTVKWLVEQGVDINEAVTQNSPVWGIRHRLVLGSTALHRSVKECDNAFFDLLLRSGIDDRIVDANGQTAYDVAVKYNGHFKRDIDPRMLVLEREFFVDIAIGLAELDLPVLLVIEIYLARQRTYGPVRVSQFIAWEIAKCVKQFQRQPIEQT